MVFNPNTNSSKGFRTVLWQKNLLIMAAHLYIHMESHFVSTNWTCPVLCLEYVIHQSEAVAVIFHVFKSNAIKTNQIIIQ